MESVLHVIDSQTAPEAVSQLRLLCEGEGIVCLDEAGEYAKQKLDFDTLHSVTVWPTVAGGMLSASLDNEVKLLHAWSPSAATAALYAAQKKGLEVVLSLPGIEKYELPETIMQAAGRKELHLAVQTNAARRRLVARGIPGGVAHVVPPAAKVTHNANYCGHVRARMGLDDGRIILAAPGPITRLSGHKYVLWVFGILRRLTDELCVVIPDSGPAISSIRYFASTVEYNDTIFFTHDELSAHDVLAASDVAMFTHEIGCPAAIADALAAGVATVSWKTAETEELTDAGKYASLTPPGDLRISSQALLKTIEQLADVERMVRDGAEYAQRRFDPAGVNAEWENVYRSVLNVESRATPEKINE